jgi:prepilin-type N-terminal cleavage/methylation domain-containing protein
VRSLSDRGFTLVELIVALALGAVVAAGAYRAIVGSQRVTQAGAQKMDVQQNLRSGAAYVGSVVRELDAADGDISVATSSQMQFRSMQWVGVICAAPVASGAFAVVLRVRSNSVRGLRSPDPAQDSALVFADGDPVTRADDTWLVGGVLGIGNAVCSDGSAATDVTVEITGASGGQAAALANVTAGAPVRGFQGEELSLFQTADSRWWMGQRMANRSAAWTTVRPLVGPLEAGGLVFSYHDTTGAVTAVLTEIASVSLVMRGESERMVRGLGGHVDYARDSIVARVALRNNTRF